MCALVRGEPDESWNVPDDIVLQASDVLAFVASVWWPRNAGHVVVIPKQHYENIFDLPPELATPMQAAAREVALAFKEIYRCDGVSTRQHNEPAGNQAVWHYHVHVFPRFTGDDLYASHGQQRPVPPEERRPYAEKLRAYFSR